MNIKETSGIPWGDFIGKVFDTASAERQADRAHSLKMAEINALKTTAGANESYTAGQPVGGFSIPQSWPLFFGIAAIGIGIFLAVK